MHKQMTLHRRLSVAGAALFLLTMLSACATTSPDDRQQNRITKLHAIAIEYYLLWASETPTSCDSPTLRTARFTVLNTANSITPALGPDAPLQAGSWVLDVADGVKARGCKEAARGLYAKVVSTYVGTGYARLRDRAMLGMADLRP